MDIFSQQLYLMLAFGAIIGIIAGKVIHDPVWRIKLRNKMKKPRAPRPRYGFADILLDGGTKVRMTKNFNGDKIEWNNGVWLFKPGAVEEVVRDPNSGMLSKLHRFDIKPEHIKVEDGVPVITFLWKDMRPLTYAELPETPGSKNPYQLNSALMQFLEAAKLEAMKLVQGKLRRLILIAIIIGVIALIISGYNAYTINKLGEQVADINTNVAEIVKTIVTKPAAG